MAQTKNYDGCLRLLNGFTNCCIRNGTNGPLTIAVRNCTVIIICYTIYHINYTDLGGQYYPKYFFFDITFFLSHFSLYYKITNNIFGKANWQNM